MASSDRVQRDHRRGYLRAFAVAVVVMRSALVDIGRSIRSRCALVWLSAAFIRESRSVSLGHARCSPDIGAQRRDFPELGFGIAVPGEPVFGGDAVCGEMDQLPKVTRPAHDDDRPEYRLLAHGKVPR